MSDKPINIYFEEPASSNAPSTNDAETSAPKPKPFVTDLDARAIALFMTIEKKHLNTHSDFIDEAKNLIRKEAEMANIITRAGDMFFKGQCAKAEYRKSMHDTMRDKAPKNPTGANFKAFLNPAERMVLSNQIYIPAMRNAYQYQSPTKKSYYRLSNPGMLENYSLPDGILNMARLGPTAPRASIDAARLVLTQLVAAANKDNGTKKLFLTDLTGSGVTDGECHAAAAVKIAARELMRDRNGKVEIIVQNSSVYGLGMDMSKMFYDPFNRSNAVNTDIYDLSSQDTNTSQNVQNARTLYQSAVAHYNKQTFSPNPEQFFVLAAQKIYAREKGYLCASWCKSGKDREAVLTNMVQAMDMCIKNAQNKSMVFNLYDKSNNIDPGSLAQLATAYWQCFTTQLDGKNQHEAIAGRLSPGADGTMEHIALLPKELKNAILKQYPHAEIVFEVSHAKGKLNKKQNWKKAIEKRDELINELGLQNAPPDILKQLQSEISAILPEEDFSDRQKVITDLNTKIREYEKSRADPETIKQYQQIIGLLELDQCITKANKANPDKNKPIFSKKNIKIAMAVLAVAAVITATVFFPPAPAVAYAFVALADSIRVGMEGGFKNGFKNGVKNFAKWLTIVPVAAVAALVSVIVHKAIDSASKFKATATKKPNTELSANIKPTATEANSKPALTDRSERPINLKRYASIFRHPQKVLTQRRRTKKTKSPKKDWIANTLENKREIELAPLPPKKSSEGQSPTPPKCS